MSYRLVALAAVVTSLSSPGFAGLAFSFEQYSVGQTIDGLDGWSAGSGAGAGHVISSYENHHSLNSLMFSGANGVAASSLSQRLLPFTRGDLKISLWVYLDPTTDPNRLFGVYFSPTAGSLEEIVGGITIAGDGTVRAGKTYADTRSGPGIGTVSNPLGRWQNVRFAYNRQDNRLNLQFSSVNTTLQGISPDAFYFHLGTDSLGSSISAGEAYFDHVDWGVNVPEPGSAATLIGGMALVLTRGRRRAIRSKV